MRAILVSVGYDDLLAITLPYNRHHFKEVAVVTSPEDEATIRVALENRARVITTDAFTRNGAVFNKWLALEEGLELFGRKGQLTIMDADILWPKEIGDRFSDYRLGYLVTPVRRLWLDPRDPIPPESEWPTLPLFRDLEWAGYTQMFWCEDIVLPEPPWHQTDWIHAGGADSFFQQLWREQSKIRPSWECLHLGIPGQNWFGRATIRADGRIPDGAPQARQHLENMRLARIQDPRCDFANERLLPPPKRGV